MRPYIAFILLPVFLWIGTWNLAAQVPFDSSVYIHGYDIPLGVSHGTWDFDEWPGIDHDVVYKKNFRYNAFEGEKIKIDYRLSTFDSADHTGYLRTPHQLKARGFVDLHEELGHIQRKIIVGVFAHPDDEVLLAGGLLGHAALSGWDVRIFLASNGADGSAGTSAEILPELGGYNSFGIMKDGSIRVETDIAGNTKTKTIEEYAKILGANIEVIRVHLQLDGKSVVQLGEVQDLDWERSFGPQSKARNALHDAVRNIIGSIGPSVVVTHGRNGEYGSYLHKTVHAVVKNTIRDMEDQPLLLTGFPEYNYHDHITHFIDLDRNNKRARDLKFRTFEAISFLHQPGMDYDKPWDPADSLLDGSFVKDYGYTPIKGYPPRYEFFQLMTTDDAFDEK